MKAPDKIYIEQKAVMYDLVNIEPCKPDDYEYIRKDALLEWVSGELMPGNSAEGKGWNLALQTLIDKLNSM